jgi:hypothetical protein
MRWYRPHGLDRVGHLIESPERAEAHPEHGGVVRPRLVERGLGDLPAGLRRLLDPLLDFLRRGGGDGGGHRSAGFPSLFGPELGPFFWTRVRARPAAWHCVDPV